MAGTWRKKLAAGLVAGAFAGIGLIVPFGSTAVADPTGLSWPTDPVHLTKEGATFVGSFTVFNPTQATITVTLPGSRAACHMSLQRASNVSVAPNTSAVVPVTSSTTCTGADLADLSFVAHATSRSGSDDQTLTTQTEPDWSLLAVLFGAGAIIAAVSVAIGFALTNDKDQHPSWYLVVDATAPSSWMANVTALGALFSGFFVTTDLLKSILGTDPTAQLGFIAVGAAMAVAFSGAAGLVTGAPTNKSGSPRVWQFLLGAGLTAAGALGQVGVVAVALTHLDLGLSSTVIRVTAGLAGLLLVGYVVASVKFYLDQYAVDPGAPNPVPTASPDLVAAIMAPLATTYHDPVAEADSWIDTARALAARVANPDSPVLTDLTSAATASRRHRFARDAVASAIEGGGIASEALVSAQADAAGHEEAARAVLPVQLRALDEGQLTGLVESARRVPSESAGAPARRKLTTYLL